MGTGSLPPPLSCIKHRSALPSICQNIGFPYLTGKWHPSSLKLCTLMPPLARASLNYTLFPAPPESSPCYSSILRHHTSKWVNIYLCIFADHLRISLGLPSYLTPPAPNRAIRRLGATIHKPHSPAITSIYACPHRTPTTTLPTSTNTNIDCPPAMHARICQETGRVAIPVDGNAQPHIAR